MQSEAPVVEHGDGKIILVIEIPDEALEAAAGVENEPCGGFTVAACTGLAACPS